MRRPLGRVQPSETSPTGSGRAATWRRPPAMASIRAGREPEPVEQGRRHAAGLLAGPRRRRWPRGWRRCWRPGGRRRRAGRRPWPPSRPWPALARLPSRGCRAGPSGSQPCGKSMCRLRRPSCSAAPRNVAWTVLANGQTRRVLPDPVLDDAVRAFCDALTPRGPGRWRRLGHRGRRRPARRRRAGGGVQPRRRVHRRRRAAHRPELWAFIAAFGPRFGGSLARSAPADVRSARLLADRVRFLDEPSELAEVLLTADARDGTDLASLYYDRALAIGFAVASLDQHTAPVELAAIERFRGRLLDRIADDPRRRPARRPPTRRRASGRRSAPAAPEVELPPARPVDEVLAELDELIGLDAVKAEVKKVADLTRVAAAARRARAAGARPVPPPRASPATRARARPPSPACWPRSTAPSASSHGATSSRSTGPAWSPASSARPHRR